MYICPKCKGEGYVFNEEIDGACENILDWNEFYSVLPICKECGDRVLQGQIENDGVCVICKASKSAIESKKALEENIQFFAELTIKMPSTLDKSVMVIDALDQVMSHFSDLSYSESKAAYSWFMQRYDGTNND